MQNAKYTAPDTLHFLRFYVKYILIGSNNERLDVVFVYLCGISIFLLEKYRVVVDFERCSLRERKRQRKSEREGHTWEGFCTT